MALRVMLPASYDNREDRYCKENGLSWFTTRGILWIIGPFIFMAVPKNKQEARLQELIVSARRRNIQVRTEKLLREAGYRARSGSCRFRGQEVILIDRDARISDQIEFLMTELADRENLQQSGGRSSAAASEQSERPVHGQ